MGNLLALVAVFLLLMLAGTVVLYVATRTISIAYFKTRSEYDRGEIERKDHGF